MTQARERRVARWLAPAVLAAGLLLVVTAPRAQSPAPDQDAGGWHYELDLLGWGSGLSGDVGPAVKEYQISESFSDILEYLDMAAMAHFDARKDRWGLYVDAFYVNLGESVDNPYGQPVKANLEELILGMAGYYRAYESPKSSFDFTFGARYNEVKIDLTPKYLPAHHRGISWTDPVIGFKGGVRLGKVWSFGYRADLGGFGVGSDFTWLGAIRFDARVSKHTTLGIGYAAYNVDYKKGSGYQEFTYDVTTYGPVLGIAFTW